jgi:hypothetical protein
MPMVFKGGLLLVSYVFGIISDHGRSCIRCQLLRRDFLGVGFDKNGGFADVFEIQLKIP